MSDDSDTEQMSPDDLARWRGARSLEDLGELTARWLEGGIEQTPTHLAPPDTETAALIPVLAAANRAGFVTHQSQPGVPACDGCAQRASVSGYAAPPTFARLMAAASDADLMITAARALDAGDDRSYGPFHAITIDDGEEFTWDGIALSRADLDYSYGYECHPSVVDELFAAWQVTLIDPVWGRNDVLWPVLQAFAIAAENMTSGTGQAST
jgi:hypothetical protein